MALALSGIPTNIRKPFFYGSFSTGLTAYDAQMRTLIIGPKLAAGNATAGVPMRVPFDLKTSVGSGSILGEMAVFSRLQQTYQDYWYLPIDDTGLTKASATITVNSVPGPGTYPLWVMGRLRRKQVTVVSGDTTATLATKIATAINTVYSIPDYGSMDMPVTAAAATNVVTVTSRHGGTFLNDRPWIHLAADGEVSGLQGRVAIAFTNGSGVPDVAAALANCNTVHFNWIISAYDDAAVMSAIATYLENQWSAVTMRYGASVYAKLGESTALVALGDAMNDKTRVIACMQATPTPTWVIASQLGAELADTFNLGQPLESAQRMVRALMGHKLRHVEAPMAQGDVYADETRNLMYYDGLSPLVPQIDGSVITERVITTYQRNTVTGLEDTAWLDISQVMGAAYAMYYIRDYVSKVFQQCSLASDERPYRDRQCRPQDYTDACVQAYIKLANDGGLVDDVEGYRRDLQVELNSTGTRIDALHPVVLAKPFYVAANELRIR